MSGIRLYDVNGAHLSVTQSKEAAMASLDVRIVELEPLRVACAHGFGPSPEGAAWEKMRTFITERGLTDYRHFGFNNPDPSPGSPNYGYDIWITVEPEVEGTQDIQILDFAGGLYAVTRCEGLQNIGQVWHDLAAWREDSAYHYGPHQWLENLLTDPDVPPEAYVFDLYLPVSR
jgi:DNA gyrase inhibitor GyrI